MDSEGRVTVIDEVTMELTSKYKASTELFAQLDQLLERNNLTYAAIARMYVASGPGSYTGARLLVTIVKTIVYLYPKINVFDSSLLDILLQSSKDNNNYSFDNYGITVARKNKYYVAHQRAEGVQTNNLKSTSEVASLLAMSNSCFVNGVEVRQEIDLTTLRHTLDIDAWVKVSKIVTDITLYEPYYLESVNIG